MTLIKKRRLYIYNQYNLRNDLIIYAKHKENILGLVTLEQYCLNSSSYPIVILNNLYVKQQWRRYGIATRLVNHAINKAHNEAHKNIELAILHDNAPARRFWDNYFKNQCMIKLSPLYTYYYICH